MNVIANISFTFVFSLFLAYIQNILLLVLVVNLHLLMAVARRARFLTYTYKNI